MRTRLLSTLILDISHGESPPWNTFPSFSWLEMEPHWSFYLGQLIYYFFFNATAVLHTAKGQARLPLISGQRRAFPLSMVFYKAAQTWAEAECPCGITFKTGRGKKPSVWRWPEALLIIWEVKSNEAKCFKVGVLLFYFHSSTNNDPSGSDLTVLLPAEILFSLLIDGSLKQPFSI